MIASLGTRWLMATKYLSSQQSTDEKSINGNADSLCINQWYRNPVKGIQLAQLCSVIVEFINYSFQRKIRVDKIHCSSLYQKFSLQFIEHKFCFAQTMRAYFQYFLKVGLWNCHPLTIHVCSFNFFFSLKGDQIIGYTRILWLQSLPQFTIQKLSQQSLLSLVRTGWFS